MKKGDIKGFSDNHNVRETTVKKEMLVVTRVEKRIKRIVFFVRRV